MTPDPPEIPVPRGEVTWMELARFALTYNAYQRLGNHKVGPLANECFRRWKETGVLPSSLEIARNALFYEQRRFRHFDRAPAGEELTHLKACWLRSISYLEDSSRGHRTLFRSS